MPQLIDGFALLFCSICLSIAFVNKDDLLPKFAPRSSPVDWCEDNYVWSPYVAEFWNTVSSLSMAVPAILGWAHYNGSRVEKHEPKIVLVWWVTALVSFGSVMFHGTLR